VNNQIAEYAQYPMMRSTSCHSLYKPGLLLKRDSLDGLVDQRLILGEVLGLLQQALGHQLRGSKLV
jgi:hypothetical protein